MSETIASEAPVLNRATPNLNKALSQLQGELPKVTKTKEGKIEGQNKDGRPFSYKYGYADLADVTATVGPLLAKYGLAFHAAPTRDPADRREMILAWSLLHESGEERSGEWPLGPANQKPQSLGSAITYGRRYTLGAATGIVAEDDDDGQSAQREHGNGQSAADAFESAAPARPRPAANGNGTSQRNQQPEPLAPDDPWQMKVDEVGSTGDADIVLRELKELVNGGEMSPERADQIKAALDAKVAGIRRQREPSGQQSRAKEGPNDDAAWVERFRATLKNAAVLSDLDGKRGELGRAIAGRLITADTGNALSGEYTARRRELEQQGSQEKQPEMAGASA